jgi:hypothetical protein
MLNQLGRESRKSFPFNVVSLMPSLPIRNTNVVDLIDESFVFNAISRKTGKTGKNVVSEASDDPTCQCELDQLLKIKRGGNHIYKIIRAQEANLDRNPDRILTQRDYRHFRYKNRAIRLAVRRYIPAREINANLN